MSAPKLSPAQRLCLQLVSEGGEIVCAGGGYWVSSAVGLDVRYELAHGIRTSQGVPNVGTTTVYACEAHGWLEPSHTVLPRHQRPRRITDAGRVVLANELERVRRVS